MIYALETVNGGSLQLRACFEGPPDAYRWLVDRGARFGDLHRLQSQLQFDRGYFLWRNSQTDDERVALVDLDAAAPTLDYQAIAQHLVAADASTEDAEAVRHTIEQLPQGTADEFRVTPGISRSGLVTALAAAGQHKLADDVRYAKAPLPVLAGRARCSGLDSGAELIEGAIAEALADERELLGDGDDADGDDSDGGCRAYCVQMLDWATQHQYSVLLNARDESDAFARARAALRASGCRVPRQLSASTLGDGVQLINLDLVAGTATRYVTPEHLDAAQKAGDV